MVENPQTLYHAVEDKVRRHLNETFYERFYIDDLEATGDKKTPLLLTCTTPRRSTRTSTRWYNTKKAPAK